MRLEIKALAATNHNAEDAIGLFKTADASLGEMTSMIQRMRELAITAANGNLKNGVVVGSNLIGGDRMILNNEFNQLRQQVFDIGEMTKFNGQRVFDASTRTFRIGESNNDTISFYFNRIGRPNANPYINKGGIFDTTVMIPPGSPGNLGYIESFSDQVIFIGSNNTVSIATQGWASAALGQLDNVLGMLSDMRGQMGAMVNRIEHHINHQNTIAQNITAAESRIRDADMAATFTHFNREQILMQSGQRALSIHQQHKSNNALGLLL
jgi:flagellin